MHLGVDGVHISADAFKPEDSIRSLGAGVTLGCDPPDMGAGNQTCSERAVRALKHCTISSILFSAFKIFFSTVLAQSALSIWSVRVLSYLPFLGLLVVIWDLGLYIKVANRPALQWAMILCKNKGLFIQPLGVLTCRADVRGICLDTAMLGGDTWWW